MNCVCTSLKKPSNSNELVPNIRDIKNTEAVLNVYLRCSFVCLFSAISVGKADRAILITDFEVGSEWKDVFSKHGIDIFCVGVVSSEYAIDSKFQWRITQFKYDAMKYLTTILQEDDLILFLDNDTIVVDTLDDLFRDASNNLLLYNTRHSYSHAGRSKIRRNYETLYGYGNPEHFGGELISCKVGEMKNFVNICGQVCLDMKGKAELLDNVADEHITSIAIERYYTGIVRNASPYIYRFWTGNTYIVSTNWYYDRVSIWHLPGDKLKGFAAVYKLINKNGVIPDYMKLARIMGMPSVHISHRNNLIKKLLSIF